MLSNSVNHVVRLIGGRPLANGSQRKGMIMAARIGLLGAVAALLVCGCNMYGDVVFDELIGEDLNLSAEADTDVNVNTSGEAPPADEGNPPTTDGQAPPAGNESPSTTGGSTSAPPLQGDEIFIVIDNRTPNMIDAQVSYRTSAGFADSYVMDVPPGGRHARYLVCGTTEITLGNVDDETVSGVSVRLGAGSVSDPRVAVEPLEELLTHGVDYECGDEIAFIVMTSRETESGYTVMVTITPGE